MHARKKESFKILARLVRPLIPFCVVLAGLLLIRGPAALATVESKKAGAIKTTEKKVFIQKAVKLQMPFISNLGQMKDENIRFYTRTFGGVAHITRTGAVVFAFPVVGSNEKPGKNLSKTKSLKSWVLKETFVGAANSNPQGMERAQTKVNYFIGNDRSRWKTNVPTYNSISLGEIYKGIELSLKAYGKTVEKIFTVRQGADPSTIKIRVDGATSLKINDKGELELESGLGVARFSKPLAYQHKNGNRQNVQVAYHVNKNSYGFKPGNYDKSLPLLIDPVLTYSTYVGGSSSDDGRSIAVDDAGNTYITGSTESMADFPTSTGPHHGGFGVGGSTVFVTKLSADGSTLLYSTYLGGIGNDSGTDIAVDGDGNAYVTGRTFSTDFPTTTGAYLTSREGGTSAVISKLSADGSGLLYSTYLGGGGANPDIHQTGWGLAVDTAGYAYITGYVSAPMGVDPGFPTSAGSLQSSYGGGSDAFMAVIDPAGNGSLDLVYATYLGGNGDENGWDIALDDEGFVYVTGETSSTDFPTTVNSFQSSRTDSTTAAFMTRIDPAGNGLNDLDYSTFLGSNDNSDYGHGIAVDGLGYVYLSGYTYSANFPTMYTLQQKAIDSSADAFVAKIFPAANGSDDLIYSTYLGGGSDDRGHSIALGTNGDAYLTGMTLSSDFPEKNAIQIVSGGNHDAFITRLNFNDANSQLQLVYSTYLGGSSTDFGWHIAVDDMGNTYVTGSSGSPDFPTTPDGYQISSGGGTDVFVAKISGGTVWYVKPVGAGLQDGTSWDDAFSAIQDAIDAAGEGDEIWVAEGIYILNQNILVNKAVAIYGGFSGTETDRTQRNWANHVTTVDGNNSVNHCFVILANALVDGFTITAAGGVSPGYSGGGIYNQSCDPVIKNCVFTANSNDFGGGLANFNASPRIVNCLFTGNDAESGGGISNRGNSNPSIVNCTLYGNNAVTGGGIYNDASAPVITNCILWENTASTSPEIQNVGASPIVSFSNVRGGYAGTNNIDADPQFEDPAEGNFHLHSDSPSIDTGDNAAVATIPFDFEGETRLFDGDYEGTDTVDMGADEYVDEDDDHMADWWELFHFGDLSHDGGGDDDIDDLNDLAEYQHKTDPNDPDSDDDGALDGNEIANGTNPNLADSDGDGVNDGTDNCPLVDNPGQEDIDGDGLGDACDDDPVYTGDLYWDFEGGLADWGADNGVWEVGTPTAGPGACYSGTQCAGTVLSGNYPSSADSRLISAPMELPVVAGSDQLHLRFWQWFNYYTSDTGTVQISVWDAGSGSWQPWADISEARVYSSGAWSRSDVDVTAHVGQRVRFGFYHYTTNDAGLGNGWFIDDIEVVAVSVIGSQPPFSEDFEGGLADWGADNGVWEVGTPTAGPGACYSGTQCAGTVLSGNYPSSADSRLISAPMELPVVAGSDQLHLRFWQWFNYYTSDTGTVQISVWDAGSGSWQPWADISEARVYSSGAWSRSDVDVTAHVGQRVRFGFYHYTTNDAGLGNGWFIDDIEVVAVSVIDSQPPFSEDFEGGLADWGADNGVWEIGTPTAGPAACYSGTQCAGTVLSGNYPSSADSRLISAPMELPVVAGSDQLHLRFWQWFNYYTSDTGTVQISVWDAGSGSWQPWADISEARVYSSGAWSRSDVDVTAHVGQRVRFGFYHYTTNDAGLGNGWFIDDIEVVAVSVIGSQPPFSEDFEGGLADWGADNGVWEVGTPTAGPGACYSGTQCAGTVLSGNYPSSADSRLISAPMELPVVAGSDQLHLRFWQWFNYYTSDTGTVQISVWDAGSGSWQPWADISEARVYSSGAWSRSDVDVTAHVGQRVRFGFYHYTTNDAGLGNGWFIDDIEVVAVSVIGSQPPFSEDFEGGLADWGADNGVWEVGTPTAGPGACYSGTQCAGTVLSGNYPSSADSRLISAPMELPVVAGSDQLHLRFWQWFNYYTSDTGTVQISVWDAGSGSWQPWADISEARVYSSGAWSRSDVDVTAHVGQRVRFGFYHYTTNDAGLGNGWFIDDIEVVAVSVIDSQPPFSEDFEGGLADWGADNGVWEIGTPTAGPAACYSGTQCAGTVLSGNYPSSADSRLISAPMELPAVAGSDQLHLRFWQWFNYYTSDTGTVQISLWDAGSGSWQPWADISEARVYSSGAWSRSDVDVTAHVGQRVRFGFYHYTTNDAGLGNGWFIDDIEVVAVSVIGSQPPFSEDFEGGLADWGADNGVWEIGTPTAGPAACYSGTQCAGTVLSGNYPSSADSRLISAPMELPVVAGSDQLHLRFWQWFNYYTFDTGTVQISVWDAGSGSWQPWADISEARVYSSGAWSRSDVDVTAHVGQRVRFGFYHYTTNDAGLGNGWFIDDIEVITNDQALDGDGDGLPDSWEQQIIDYDTGDGINTVDDVDPADDFDGDWVSNQREYQNNTIPTDSGDFTPPGTGAIRGTVNDSGGSPINTIDIRVQVIIGDPCGGWQQIDDVISSDGNYIVVGLNHNQDYWVRSDNMWQSNYVNEWYASPSSSIECTGALLISVPENGSADGIDFQLDMGTEVSGIVNQADGTTPIQVVAFRANDPCQNHTWSVGTQTDISNGSFTLKGVPVGTASVYLNTGNMNQSNNVNEWWRNVGSTSDCSLAEMLDVSGGGVTGLSFQLDLGGSISGWITDAIGDPIPNLWVHVNDSLCGNGQWFGGDETDATGYYKIWGIPESDDVFVQTCANCWGLNWVDEWWDGVGNTGSIDCNGAAPIPISPGIDSDGINFQLDTGADISGTVYQSNGSDPITGVPIRVHVYQGDPCGSHQYVRHADTDPADGTYTVSGIPLGTYYLQTWNINQSNYMNEWWASGGSTYDCSGAGQLTLDAGGETGIDFQLDLGGSISGIITHQDTGDPIANANIQVYNDNWQHIHGIQGNSDGTYILGGIPTGSYYVEANGQVWVDPNWEWPYQREFYIESSNQNGAVLVEVTLGAETQNINFTLEEGVTISGAVTRADNADPIANTNVVVYDNEWNQITNVNTEKDGKYTVGGIPPGNYYIGANGWGSFDGSWQRLYIEEYYNEASDRDSAQLLTVTDATSGVDFTLEFGGSISGIITHQDTGDLIANANIQVYNDNWQHILGIQSKSDGSYTLGGLPTGSYYVEANGQVWVDPNWEWPYQREYYNESSDQNGAALVTVTIGAETQNINLTLVEGVIISGTVTRADNGDPISNANVNVFDGNWEHVSGTQTGLNGSYILGGFPAGTYYVGADGWGNFNGSWQRRYVAEYYDDSLTLENADPLLVTDQLQNINFELQEDIDADEMADDWETIHFGDLSHDGNADSDQDGLIDRNEYKNVTDPNNEDSDGDWVNDGDEVNNGTNPNDDTSFTQPGTGAIRGIVNEAGNPPIPIITDQIQVYAISGDPCGNWGQTYSTITNTANGTYIIVGLPPGQYYLRTDNMAQSDYINEWWAQPESTIICNNAQPIDVTSGADITGKDFQLDTGGTISGVVRRDSDDQTIENISIEVWEYDTGIGRGAWSTQSGGTYTITGLPPGDYRLMANASGTTYASEYYNNVLNWDSAARVSVSTGVDTSDIDFSLGQGGSISGMVRSDSGDPIANAWISAHNRDNGTWFGGVNTESNGSYTLSGLPPGDYRVEVDPWSTPYSWEIYSNTYNYNEASSVPVSVGVDTPNINFSLAMSGSISGVVKRETDDQPISGMLVHAHSFSGGQGDSTRTQSDGSYILESLPPVGYRVEVDPEGSNYIREYYDNTTDWNSAKQVVVIAGTATSDIDFLMAPGFPIIGTMMRVKKGTGDFKTKFEIEIENFGGTLPDDINTISITAPSGNTLPYTKNDFTYLPQWQVFSLDIDGSPPELGVYTFTITSGGATGTDTDFYYIERDLPEPDINSFSPADGTIVDSKTPSFTWGSVDYGEDIALYYRLEIMDAAGENRVYATARMHDTLYHTVPEDTLQPNTDYTWRVRISDSDNWEYVENRTNSDLSAFTTAGTFVHTNKPAIFPDDWLANTYSTENSSNVLLWVRVLDHDGVASDGSSHQVTVTLPGGGTVPMQYDRTDAADIVAYYAWDNNPPASGQYTFTVTDPDGNVGTLVEDYTSNPLDIPDENSLTPSNKNPVSENITATYDNVYVNGALYDNFDSYSSIEEIDFSKWQAYYDNASIVGGTLVLDVNDVVGRGHGALNFTYPETINSIRADITVNSISDLDGPPKAEIKGTWCSNSRAEINAGISVVGNRVYYSVWEDYLINRDRHWFGTFLDSGDLMTGISPGETITVEISISGNTLTFNANGNNATYTIPGTVYPVREYDNWKSLRTRINLVTDTTPTFTWAPVTNANRYRIRIFNWDRTKTIGSGYPGNVTSYTFPPGTLIPDAYYNYRFEAWDAPSPLNVDNVSKTPASNDDNYRFYTGSEQAVDPYIDLTSHGVHTFNTELYGPVLTFWIKVHDAQGVPDTITSVQVESPGGAIVDLEPYCSNQFVAATPTSCIYYAEPDLPIENGTYTFTVGDQEGHPYSVTEEFTSNVIGYPALSSLRPLNNRVIGSTAVDFDWDDVPGALFYSIDIFDYDYNLVYQFHTPDSEFHLAEGFLKENTFYRYRVKTRREYFSQNNDNMSSSPDYWHMLTFTTTELTDTDADGMPDEWENRYPGLDPGVEDAAGDLDTDGLTNLEEYQNGTDPTNPDSDNDEIPDGWESDNNLNPLSNDANQDPDNDGLTNLEEFQVGADPNSSDTDGDGVIDGQDNCPLVPNPNQEDINTNGIGDACEDDADGDGYIDENSGGDDCNDLDATIHPDGAEIPGDGIDQDCDGSDTVDISPGTYYVDPVNGTDNTTHGTGSTDQAWKSMYYAVQLINAGTPGAYTLNLAAGTYSIAGGEPDEALNLNQNIEIIGAGQGVTILDGAGAANWKSAFTIYNGAPDVRVQDLTIRNFENGIALSSDGGCYFFTNMEIKLCTTGLQIVDGHLLRIDLSGSVISENTTGIKQAAGSSNNLILYGTVSNNSGDGIIIYDGSGHEIHECTITGNNTSETAYGGVAVIDASATLRRNVIDGNHCYGVYADDGLSTQHLDATYNYWGDADGPSGEGPGTAGDAVSEHVDFIPWFEAIPSADTDGDGLADDNDNCPANANADQADYDDDGIGDVCDPDADGDGFTSTVVGGLDCNDNDAFSYPGATEVPNDTVDQDCDGSDLKSDLTPATYYVDPVNGNDDATHGTDPGVQAWKTIKFAVEMINNGAAGDYVLTLAPGTYSPDSEVLDIPLVLEQNVTINGSGAVLDGSGSPDSAQNPWTVGFIVSPGASKISIQNLTIENFEQGLVVQSDGGCVDLINVVIDSCESGLKLVGSYQTEVDLHDSVITGCTSGIEITSDSSSNTIRNGTVSNNSGDGILVDVSNVAPSDNLITDIDVLDNAKSGIVLRGGAGTQVTDCLISGNNSGIDQDGYGGIAVLACCASLKWNTIENNQCSGIYADEASSLEIHGNLIRENREGIQLALTSDVTIQNNTITENIDGLVIEEGSSPEVTCNIVWNNGNATDLVVNGGYDRLEFNDVGTTNLPGLPPTNISQDPQFKAPATDDYSLAETSPCIDDTDLDDAGRDLADQYRPLGSSWDMGAYESPGYADLDGDKMPDWWEWRIIDYDTSDTITSFEQVIGTDDFDGDGVDNWNEWLNGTDPTTNIVVAITNPAENPAYTDSGSITIAGTVESALTVQLTVNDGDPVQATITGDTWSAANITLSPGQNLITVIATGNNTPATDGLTIVRDTADPTVTVIDPVVDGDYPTAANTISISGLASDDTGIVSVKWRRTVPDGGPELTGDAVGTNSWQTGAVLLEPAKTNVITVTAVDRFGNEGSRLITVLQEQGVEVSEDQDLTPPGSVLPEDPLDLDSDGYLNEDERACLGADSGAENDAGVVPSNYADSDYPSDSSHPEYNPNKVGYKWPDCLNPDDDGDGLPDWWENKYFGSDTAANPDDDVDIDEDGEAAPDGFSNIVEYQNGTDPTKPQYTMFELNLYDLADVIVTGIYLPEYGKTVKVRARWLGAAGSAPETVSFRLTETSSYPGRAVNDPDPNRFPSITYPLGYDYLGPDFGLAETQPGADVFSYEQGPIPASNAGDGTYTVYLQSWDFGGRTKVLVSDPAAPDAIDELWVPIGTETGSISRAWDYDDDPSTITDLEAEKDIDTVLFFNPGVYTAPLGDDFNNFEEYRGIVYIPAGGSSLMHKRLNPLRKDLFIRTVGYDDAVGDPYDAPAVGAENPFWLGLALKNAGIEIHNTTGWGHDATQYGDFFIYLTDGTITGFADNNRTVNGTETEWSTGWPVKEWEFKLDIDAGDEDPDPRNNRWMPVASWEDEDSLALLLPYQEGTVSLGAGNYKIRMPLPHINALIVRHDHHLKGVFSIEQGYIRFISATPPDQQNLTGARHWSWSTKGLGLSSANEGDLGIALTLNEPLNHYINDRPYQKGTVWDANAREWTTAQADQAQKLAPLNQVEDQADQMSPIDGIVPGDTGNGRWDGDQRTGSADNWGYGIGSGMLSPFDVDGDGYVELPFVADPLAADSGSKVLGLESSRAEVLKHTITHEIAHAIGVPIHSDVPADLMFKYSSNWNRADYLSDWFRSLIRVNNKMRF